MRISVTGSAERERGFRPVRRSAEHGFTLVRRSAEHGFTLVELMVVIAVIGLLTGAAMLAIPDPRGRVIDEAERFAARTQAARDLAIIEGRGVAVRVTAAGYAFDARQGGEWRPIQERAFRSTPWSEGTSALVRTGATERIAFDSTGLASDTMAVTLVRSGEQARVTITIDGEVRVGA